MFTPDLLPVMSTLAKSYAVFDHWYASAPTETLPNRAFMHFASAEGQVEDKTAKDHVFESESIFRRLSSKNRSWAIYGYEKSSARDARHVADPDGREGR